MLRSFAGKEEPLLEHERAFTQEQNVEGAYVSSFALRTLTTSTKVA